MLSILYNIFIKPLELFLELVFSTTHQLFKVPGISILFVSIAVQLLVFPLYKKADDLQEQEREKQKSMEPWINHIKKTFKGDERFMMMQTYYKSAGYKPIYAIKGSTSLLLQIPFFMAAYNYLSNLQLLHNASFLGIKDLSQPDQLLTIGGITLNLLPILMTLFNIISGIIYTRGLPVKDKVQVYGLAAIFLVLLYKSPSGLVFYWTLNNLFSLLKNVFLKLVKNPRRIIDIFFVLLGIAFAVYYIGFDKRLKNLDVVPPIVVNTLVVVFVLLCMVPAVLSLLKKSGRVVPKNKDDDSVNPKLVNAVFYSGITALFLLLGLVIPLSVLKSSPTEFISVNYGPFGLLVNCASVFLGLFFVWLNVFYLFSPNKLRKYFAAAAGAAAISGIISFLFFGKKLGLLNTYFIYEHNPKFTSSEMLINFAAVAFAVLIMIFLFCKKAVIVKRINQIASVSLAALSVVSIISTQKIMKSEGAPQVLESQTDAADKSYFNLSFDGKNVIVFMLDRAISGYVPFLIEDNPQLKEMYDGFTYYPNTMSFGEHTNYCTPSLFGGYEYTPTEINKKSNQSLGDKQNEALTVLPKLFLDNNYKVSVYDPPYAGYKWIPDLSIYDKYDGINAEILKGKFMKSEDSENTETNENAQKWNIMFYSIMKASPIAVQNLIYNDTSYWSTSGSAQTTLTHLTSSTVLDNLANITDVSNTDENNFIMLQNSATHDTALLDSSYELKNKTSADGTVLKISNKQHVIHYQVNEEALLKIGKWLDYLKEQGAYDNTRIIIVSDHGYELGQFDNMLIADDFDLQGYNPLLLVKDFNSKGFSVSDEFMTIADTPALSVKDVIANPLNPFTGKKIDSTAKNTEDMILTTSKNYDIRTNNGNIFDSSDGEWWMVKDNIFNFNNWKKVEVQ